MLNLPQAIVVQAVAYARRSARCRISNWIMENRNGFTTVSIALPALVGAQRRLLNTEATHSPEEGTATHTSQQMN